MFKTVEDEHKLNDRFSYCVNPGDYISLTKELLNKRNIFNEIDYIRKKFQKGEPLAVAEKEKLLGYAALLRKYEKTGIESDKLITDILADFDTYRYFYKEVGASLKFNPLSASEAGGHVLEKIYLLLVDYINLICPKVLFRYINVNPDEKGLCVEGTDIHFNNTKLRIFTNHSSKKSKEINPSDILGKNVIVYVVTIGPGIDNEVKHLTNKGEMFDAYLLNGIGAGAAEMTANDLNRFMNDNNSNKNYLYRRLSPGYGNWNVSEQTKVFKLLNPEKHIGVTLTDSHIMLPEKSTSGIMGLTLKEDFD